MSPDELGMAAGHRMTTEMPRFPAPNFSHLRAMTDRLGLWEHIRLSTPRLEHGFWTDDNARALVVVCRQAASDSSLVDLAAVYLRFVLEARISSGSFHNRRSTEGAWVDDVGSDDSQGRAWWALGAVARHGYEPWMRRAGVSAFGDCSGFASNHLRSNAFAVLGTVDLLAIEPTHTKALDLLAKTSQVLVNAVRVRIPWPEIRLTYDNARIPEALIAAGAVLGDKRIIEMGIRLLERLLWVETDGDHFSFTPVGGWQTGEDRPCFDKQPQEAAAMADACYRAWTVTANSVRRLR
ncbi:MAG: glycosyltransferase, partial [Acidimicrobiia bacterium]